MKIHPCFLMLLFCNLFVHAEVSVDESTAPAKEGDVTAVILDVNDATAIQKQSGSEVTVEGSIHNAFWVNENVLMVTFREEKEGFVAVSFAKYREKLDAAFDGSISENLKGKKVQITGKVTEFNGRPQIVIYSAAQVKILN